MAKRKHDTTGKDIAEIAAKLLAASKHFQRGQIIMFLGKTEEKTYHLAASSIVAMAASLVNQSEQKTKAKRRPARKRRLRS
jgi:hypothetical protein